ncbi:MAG: hypothetical protein JO263_02145 [Candidatus Eremiobacteraeota bacterium]|nr:hypothetical protein [Candidatus Eremiobacteraeota bacterium]
MKYSIGALALSTAAMLLAGCNGANSGSTPPGTGTNCGGPPSANQLEVLYPIPGSKSAPPNLLNVYVSTKGALPPSNSFDFFLTQSNGKSTFTGLFAAVSPSQIPSPHKSPSYANPTYYASAVAGPSGSGYIIGPAQAVNLYWNDGGTGCTPHFLVSSFKTQQ